jgi:hypothetical protein
MAVASAIRSFPREKSIVSGELGSKLYRTLPYFVGKALSELPLVALFNGIFGTIVYRLTGLNQVVGRFRNFLMILTTHGLVSEAVGLVIGAFSPSSDFALACKYWPSLRPRNNGTGDHFLICSFISFSLVFPAVLVLNIIFDGKNISAENTPKLLRWIPKLGLIRWGYEGLCVNEFDGLAFTAGGRRRGPMAKTGEDALARFGLGSYSVTDVVKAHLIITCSSWMLAFLGLSLTKQKYLVMIPTKKDVQT